jgi:competence protein ComEA
MTAPAATERHGVRLPGLTWVAVVSLLEALSFLLELGPPVQPLLSVVFVITCPGFLLLDLQRPADAAARVILGISASISLNVLIVTVALVGDRRWFVPAAALLLAGIAALPRDQLRSVVTKLGSIGRMADRVASPTPPALPAPHTELQPPTAPPPEPMTLGIDQATAARPPTEADTTTVAPDPAPTPPKPRDVEDAEHRGSAAAAADAEPTAAEPDRQTAVDATPAGRTTEQPTRPAADGPIPLNTATGDQLITVRGIGPALADAIVAHRTANGPFTDLDDLLAIRGIGPATLARIRTGARIDATPDQTQRATEAPAPTGATEQSTRPAADGPIPLNTATGDQLITVRGIGPALADAIVAHRTANGPFTDLDDLLAIRGIGPATLARIRSAATITAPGTERPAPEGSA